MSSFMLIVHIFLVCYYTSMFFDNNLKKRAIYTIFKGEKMLRLLMLAGFLFACEGDKTEAAPETQTTEGADDNNTTSNDNQKTTMPVTNTTANTNQNAGNTSQVVNSNTGNTPTTNVEETQNTDKGNETNE